MKYFQNIDDWLLALENDFEEADKEFKEVKDNDDEEE